MPPVLEPPAVVGDVAAAEPAPKVETAVVPVASNGNGVVALQQLADVVPPAAPVTPVEPDAKQQPATSASAPDEARGELLACSGETEEGGAPLAIPLSAVLEVIAVLLILAFILLRLS